MDNRLNRVVAIIAGSTIAAVVTASAVFVGCGGDDSTGAAPQDSGPPDGTLFDSQTGDVGVMPDVSVMDVAVRDVAAPDVVTVVDGAPEAGDGGPEAAPIPVPALADYGHAVDVAYCNRLRECCQLDVGQQWLQNDCLQGYGGARGVFGQRGYPSVLDGGAIIYDQTAAATCLSTLAGLNCTTVSSAAYTSFIGLCFSATKGTLGIDVGSCTDSLQCKAGEYCALVDGGTGTCVALYQAGQHCTDTRLSSECSYRGTGSPSLYCGATDAGPTCLQTRANGVHCDSPAQCQSAICSAGVNGAGCVDSYTFSDPTEPNGICKQLTVDGGGIGDAGSGDAADASSDH